MSNLDDLANAMNRRDITDEDGQPVAENDTPLEESSATEEQTTVEEDAQVEKPAEPEIEDTQTEEEGDEIDNLVELASDETGKRYVPESRFKEVYGKMKGYERKLKEGDKPKEAPIVPAVPTKPLEKADQVEIELLRATLPQFNPDSDDYSRELDELGFAIHSAQPGMSRIEAARKALTMAKKIQSKVAKVEQEAKTVKSQQSDRGITSRVTARVQTNDTPGENSSPEEMEEWLRAHGQW